MIEPYDLSKWDRIQPAIQVIVEAERRAYDRPIFR
jgi:hypothetical protein